MGIQVNARTDYSMLFSGLNQSNNNNRSAGLYGINIADYFSIKSGSYGKLVKAYYKQQDEETKVSSDKKNSSSVTRTSVDDTVKKELTAVHTAASDVSKSAAALLEKGSKSPFKEEDMNKVYEAVNSFVEDYNLLVDKGEDSPSSSVKRYTNSLANMTRGYESALKEVGITIGEDKKLSVNKETFLASDVSKVKELFNANRSYVYQASNWAKEVGNIAVSESNKSNLYTVNGTYSMLSGSFFNGTI